MLRQKIQQDTINAMKTQDKQKLEVLRYLSSQIKDEEIKGGRKELTDEQIVKLIASQIKKLKESLAAFEKGQREDLVKKTKFEIETLSVYLPAQLPVQDLEKEVDKIIAANKNLPVGALIGISVKALAGKADNATIAQLVQQKLSK
jgi:uncharacterized protein YqeY